MSSRALKTAAPLIVLAAGVGAAVLLASAREAPDREKPRSIAPLVHVEPVTVTEVPVAITGQGTVRPRERIQLVPQVPGRVIAVHPELVEGGLVRRGDVLVRIDPVDYELRVRRAEADVARAEVRVRTEGAEAELAREEWDRLHPGEEPNALVVREPQVRQAEAELAGAEAALAEARLALDRTRLTAPFDAKVESESADLGQVLVAGQPIAALRGLEVLEVPVPLENSDLAFFDPEGAPATVTVPFGGRSWTWEATVDRLARVDPATRMVTVIVEVRDAATGERPRLEPGLFAEVEIAGRPVRAAAAPRHAIHDGVAWIVDDDSLLRIRPIEVARTTREVALVTDGLRDGDRLVTTALEAVTDGMPVRLDDAGEAGDAPPAGPTADASGVDS